MAEFVAYLGRLVADVGFVLGGVWQLAGEFASAGIEGARELWRGGPASLGEVLEGVRETLGYAVDDLMDAIRARGQ